MAVLKGGSKNRRSVRKNIPRTTPNVSEITARPEFPYVVAFSLLFVTLASVIVLQARSEPNPQVGRIVDRTIHARVDFEVIDTDATQRLRAAAREQTPRVYQPNPAWFDRSGGLDTMRQRLLNLPETVASLQTVDDVKASIRDEFRLSNATLAALEQYDRGEAARQQWRDKIDRLIEQMRGVLALSKDQFQQEKQSQARGVTVSRSANQREYSDAPLYDVTGPRFEEKLTDQMLGGFADPVRESLVHFITTSGEPTYVLDEQATRAAQENAVAGVEPIRRTFSPDRADRPMVTAGTVLDRDGYQLLATEHRHYLRSLPLTDQVMWRLGPILLVLLVTVGLMACVVAFQPRVGENWLRAATLVALLLATLVIAWLTRPLGPHFATAALVGPLLLTGVILAIAYDRRFAIAVTILHAGLFGLAFELSVPMVLVIGGSAIVAIMQMRELRNRSTLIRIGLITAAVVVAGVWAVGAAERNLMLEGVYGELLLESVWAGIAALAVGFFVLGMLPFIEQIFNVTTSMTLLELCDVNQPLLRQLAQTAPGTYNHSLTLGIISEAAAESIGANGLLCRVAAYYHDIGKMNKPQYFIENQAGGPNKHEKLSPAMSLLIIVGHVKDGIEMAREYGLPRTLHHFIESHHGTTLVEYFYHAAKSAAAEDEQPAEIEFRYPGPKPQTREAAILMLCDSVESASRTLSDPNAARIEQLVHSIAMKRLMDGQFDDCAMTLSELHTVERSLVKSLCGIYHGRIKYPAGEKKPREEETAQAV